MLAVLILIWLLAAAPASGWWSDSHGILTRASVLAVPEELPPFFRQGGDVAAHCSIDPDLAKNRAAPHLIHTEKPEHYLNVEMLDGQELPGKRYAYLTLCINRECARRKADSSPTLWRSGRSSWPSPSPNTGAGPKSRPYSTNAWCMPAGSPTTPRTCASLCT